MHHSGQLLYLECDLDKFTWLQCQDLWPHFRILTLTLRSQLFLLKKCAEKCWRGTDAHLRPKRNKQITKRSPRQGYEASSNIKDKQSSATSGHTISQKPDSKNKMRHDSKCMNPCQNDNMSFLTNRLLFTVITLIQN